MYLFLCYLAWIAAVEVLTYRTTMIHGTSTRFRLTPTIKLVGVGLVIGSTSIIDPLSLSQ